MIFFPSGNRGPLPRRNWVQTIASTPASNWRINSRYPD